MTRVTFGIIALNAQPFLEYNLKALYPFAHQIIVVEGAARAAASLAKPDGHSKDDTLTVIQEFQKQHDPENKVLLVAAKDEGYTDGFWPEKDEMSQAYARRATGDWLWQVDSDEFYLDADKQTVLQLLAERPELGGISFPFHEFWGSFDAITTGKWYLQEFTEVRRIFRWGPGHTYTTHRPPTVLDERGRDRYESAWLSGKELRRRGIFMYHYSYVFPKQARQKVGYYSNVAWSDTFRRNEQWFHESYQALKRPLFLGEQGWPILQWLERYRGQHPQAILELRADLESGRVTEPQRDETDIQRLLASPLYLLATRLLRILMPPYWRVRSWWRLRRKARARRTA
ncbi:MAG: glycosyltransferase family 2 protein [Chloroflexi bacterium]|nr:glycosyltransferase family 2 protein [Chloroflexota bacterium]